MSKIIKCEGTMPLSPYFELSYERQIDDVVINLKQGLEHYQVTIKGPFLKVNFYGLEKPQSIDISIKYLIDNLDDPSTYFEFDLSNDMMKWKINDLTSQTYKILYKKIDRF